MHSFNDKNNVQFDDATIYPLREFSYKCMEPMFVRGENMFLFDETGKKYIDGISGLWNVSLGYGNRRILDSIINQMNELSYINLYSANTPIVKKYANRLIEFLDNDFSRVLYTCSGSESNECAIKIARKYQKLKSRYSKNKIVVFDMSYHGTTYAAMSASGIDQVESENYKPIVNGFILLNTPFFIKSDESNEDFKNKCLNDLENLEYCADDIAAFLIEPVIASGGIITLPDWYIKRVEKIAKDHDILLIFDEVATGFGRTGSMFVYQEFGIKPDIMCISKSISNGIIPMGAVLLNEKLNKIFSNNNQFVEHFSTQNGNPLACAAAYEVLFLFSEDDILSHINKQGDYLYGGLCDKLKDISNVRQIRRKGLMIGIDLIKTNGDICDFSEIHDIERRLLKKGLIVYTFVIKGKTSGLSLFPSYLLDEKISDRIIRIIYSVLSSL